MILIFGGKGQLGYEFQRALKDRKVFSLSHTELDITNIEEIRNFIKGKNIKLIINCAAYNNVDKAEEEKESCYRVNTYAVGELAKIAKEIDAEFVTFSTDFVFDGEKNEPYKEGDKAFPLSIYGKSKKEGERLAKENYEKTYIIRTSWVYGIGNRNFIKNIIEWSKEKTILKMTDDQISSPTYAKDIVNFTLKLLKLKKYGVYHISGGGEGSKYDQAKEVLSFINWNGKLERAKSEDFNQVAKRPKYSKLDCKKIEETIGEIIPHWKDSLKKFLLELQERGEI